jgi:hypothetical protein
MEYSVLLNARKEGTPLGIYCCTGLLQWTSHKHNVEMPLGVLQDQFQIPMPNHSYWSGEVVKQQTATHYIYTCQGFAQV